MDTTIVLCRSCHQPLEPIGTKLYCANSKCDHDHARPMNQQGQPFFTYGNAEAGR